jgi:trigger factor
VNITTENFSTHHVKLNVHLQPEDYLEKVNEEIKTLSRKVNMPGFRPGKVPATVVKQMYGNSVLAEELNKIISESVDNYIKDHQWRVLGQPLPLETEQQNIDIKSPVEYSFGFDIGLIPEFDLAGLDGSHVFDKKKIKVDEKMIDDEIEKIQLRYGTNSEAESIGNEDVIQAEWDEMDGDAVKENGIHATSSVGIKSIKNEDILAKVKALKKDESITFDINEAFENDHELIIHHILKIDHEAAEKMGNNFRMTIHGITHIEKTELNQELFDKLFGEKKVNSLEELRERIKEELEKEFGKISDRRLESDVQKYLLENTSIPLPEEFLKRWITSRSEKELSREEMEKEFPNIVTNVKWDLITDKIAKDNKIDISEDDLKGAVKEEFKNNYFNGQVDESMNETLDRIADNVLKEDRNRRRYADYVLNEKVFKTLGNTVKINEQEATADEFYHHH